MTRCPAVCSCSVLGCAQRSPLPLTCRPRPRCPSPAAPSAPPLPLRYGKELRLKQQFFFVSASLQDTIARYLVRVGGVLWWMPAAHRECRAPRVRRTGTGAWWGGVMGPRGSGAASPERLAG